MAYLALYRAFRPETLDKVVRQEHVVKILRNQIEQDRIGHAYLFCGPRGTGKTSIAKIFARSINCLSPVNGSPCGKCAACQALGKGAGLDIVEIDAASNNGVDEMRELREKIQYPPVNGKFKVYIIDEVHMLSSGAFNALLKTLEEPPKHAVFILATTEAQKIPATILSRCMRFDFKLIPQEDLENHLKTVLKSIGKEYEEEAVAAIARAGNGSVRDMLSIADTCVSYDGGKLTYDGVNAVLGSADFTKMSRLCEWILQGNTAEAVAETEGILSEGKGVGVLVKDVLQFLSGCSVAKTCKNARELLAMPTEKFREIKRIADQTDGYRLLRTLEIFAETETKLRYSASARIVLETAVMKASMPQTDYAPEALLARIAALEEKVANGVTAPLNPSPLNPTASAVAEEEKREGTEERKRISPFEDFPPVEEEPVFDEDKYAEERPKTETQERSKAEKAAPVSEVKPVHTEEIPLRTEEKIPVSEEKKLPETRPTAAVPVDNVPVDKNKAFGMFLRSLRKNSKNGVLFTICSELDCSFEGDKMVLLSDSETIGNSLSRPEHVAAISQALSSIGVNDYEVRVKGSKKDDFEEKLKQLRADFPATPITVK